MANKRGPYAVGIDRRELIVKTATDLVRQYGQEQVTVQMIADAVGISRTGVLHHFESRDDILIAVLDEWDQYRIPATGPDPRQNLRLFARAVGLNRDQPRLVELVSTFAARAVSRDHPAHDFFARKYAVYAPAIAAEIRSAQSAGEAPTYVDADAAADVLLAAAEGLQARWLVDRALDLEQRVLALIDLIVPPPPLNQSSNGQTNQ